MKRVSRRKEVFARDKGVCSKCGTDCENVKQRIERLKRLDDPEAGERASFLMRKFGFSEGRWWEVDHLVPLDEGGEDTLENMVTVCVPCHKEKTSEQANRRARGKRLAGKKHRAMTKMWNELNVRPGGYAR